MCVWVQEAVVHSGCSVESLDRGGQVLGEACGVTNSRCHAGLKSDGEGQQPASFYSSETASLATNAAAPLRVGDVKPPEKTSICCFFYFIFIILLSESL